MKKKVLNWTRQFDTFCFLDNHQYQLQPHSQECLLGAGIRSVYNPGQGEAMQGLQQYINDHKQHWLFGHLAYDLKNELDQQLHSSHPDGIGFSDLSFFQPAIVAKLNASTLTIEAEDPAFVFAEIDATSSDDPIISQQVPTIQQRFSREEYLATIHRLRQHILRGDCYEINFCQEFFAEDAVIDPVKTYTRLSDLSPNPFSALYKRGECWLICASPERFLSKQGRHILSQPIKGTSKRIRDDEALDLENRQALQNSVKDRAENVMVVDLVRNDLARVCEKGTVKVDELYGVYSFPQVHQMISTISGQLTRDATFADIIRATFPMGSMTGAPKKRVMELVEQYERTRRGIFSGAIGYMSPTGDFDFNVVIRSLMYNAQSRYLSFQAGSGITFYSDPEQEWEECLLKAAAIRLALEN